MRCGASLLVLLGIACGDEPEPASAAEVAVLRDALSAVQVELDALHQDVVALQVLVAGLPTVESLEPITASVDAVGVTVAALAATVDGHEVRLHDAEEGLAAVGMASDEHALQIDALATADATTDAAVADLDGRVAALEGAGYVPEANLGDLLALVPYLEVDTTTADIRLIGVNLNLQNGSGLTDWSRNGLGNLIIGYNAATGYVWRGGSHNIVMGDNNSYFGNSGLVIGTGNFLGEQSVILGSTITQTAGPNDVVVGGMAGGALAGGSVVVGGYNNWTEGEYSVAVGGDSNWPRAAYAVTVGGGMGIADGDLSVVLGGLLGLTTGYGSAVIGGQENIGAGAYSVVAAGSGLTSADDYQFVSP